jgi:membrane protein YqaA with SNARE-associated domain
LENAGETPLPNLEAAPDRGRLRRLYDWTIDWAGTPYALGALLVLAFAEACFFPVPPDVLLVAMCLARPRRGLRYAAVAVLGSVLGGMVCYGLGAVAMEGVGRRIIAFYGREGEIQLILERLGQYGFAWIFVAALTPIPYCVFVLVAGMAHEQIGLGTLLSASIVGRGLRFGVQGALFRLYGKRIKTFIDKYFNLVTIVVFVLLLMAVVAAKLWRDGLPEQNAPPPDAPALEGEAPARHPAQQGVE